jgi:hypothetical protein
MQRRILDVRCEAFGESTMSSLTSAKTVVDETKKLA